MDVKLILIGGGTASGKTTMAKKISEFFDDVLIISIDNYYNSNWNIPLKEREKINYDHPKSIEWALFKNQLRDLIGGRSVKMPQYDFTKHERMRERIHVEPASIIIVDGIFALYDEEIRSMADIKIYVDTPSDIRFIRRLVRDINERGRTMESVINQYMSTVRPMHIAFVEPTKKFADIIIPWGANDVAVDVIRTKIEKYLKK